MASSRALHCGHERPGSGAFFIGGDGAIHVAGSAHRRCPASSSRPDRDSRRAARPASIRSGHRRIFDGRCRAGPNRCEPARACHSWPSRKWHRRPFPASVRVGINSMAWCAYISAFCNCCGPSGVFAFTRRGMAIASSASTSTLSGLSSSALAPAANIFPYSRWCNRRWSTCRIPRRDICSLEIW